MDGLERIKAKIKADATERCQSILANATAYQLEQEQACQLECHRIYQEADKRAQKNAKALELRMASYAETAQRLAILNARQAVIANCLTKAVAQLEQQPAGQKLAFYLSLVRQSALQSGKIILAVRDQELGAELIRQLGANFTLGAPSTAISGGLIVQQGDLSENLSYDLFLRSHRAELSALLAQVLFPSEGEQA